MRIAIASGKGGTGKTTIATSLAYVASLGGRGVAYLDCDVEEPNGHLFLRPEWESRSTVTRPVPQVDESRCTKCGRCGEACQFSAIVPLETSVLVYPELCHGCGACMLACPVDAIGERPQPIGALEIGRASSLRFVHGVMRVGEAMSPPLIRAVKATSIQAELTVVDAPPGTSCPAVESIRGADFVVLVTEPTPFGLNDLKLGVEMVQELRLPLGVVINRCDTGDRATWEYCGSRGLQILAELPDDRRVAEAYSRGELACTAVPSCRERFEELLRTIEQLAPGPRPSAHIHDEAVR